MAKYYYVLLMEISGLEENEGSYTKYVQYTHLYILNRSTKT